MQLQNVLAVPHLGKSLYSLGQATSAGLCFEFRGEKLTIFKEDGYVPACGPKGLKRRGNVMKKAAIVM